MRSDKKLGQDFRDSRDWEFELGEFDISMTTVVGMDTGDLPETKRVSHSFSGHERNHLFRNERGQRFDDLSPVTGLDHDGDSRGFSLLDFDRDGFTDIAMINANRPTFQLYRNQLGDLGVPARSIAVRFVGGNATSEPSRFACRDGYGATVRVRADGLDLLREHRCGDGFAAQNSDVMLVGIGDRDRVDSLTVTWPSGHEQTVANVGAGTLVRAFEASGIEEEQYGPALRIPETSPLGDDVDRLSLVSAGELPVLHVTFATWCEACIRYLPQERRLHDALGKDVRIVGVPVDPADDAAKIAAWAERFRPAGELLAPLAPEALAPLQTLIEGRLGSGPLPSSVLTDGAGRVIAVWAGVPTVSDLRRRLDNLDPDE